MPYQIEELAYIAGLIDGEGYVGLVKHLEKRRQKNNKRNITLFYRPAVKIGMCDKKGIDFIKKVIGGKIWLRKVLNIRYKDQWIWSADSYIDTKKVIEAVLPYLKVKRKQAVLLLNFIKERQIKNNHKIKWGQTSYSIKETHIYNKLKLLNKTGK